MNRLPWVLALVGLALGMVLPIATLWTLIGVLVWIVSGLIVVLFALIVARPGRWAVAWRGQRLFVAVGFDVRSAVGVAL